jgi:hypothetical protein
MLLPGPSSQRIITGAMTHIVVEDRHEQVHTQTTTEPRVQRSAPASAGGWPARVACHIFAEAPLLVLVLVQMAKGWRPISDNAAIAWRSWDVFSLHLPLVGQYTVPAGSHTAYGLGPLEFWILAIPVRLDPGQGALWGGVLACVVAIALGIEAARAVAGPLGSGLAAAAVSMLVLTRPDLALALPWNPAFGAFWLLAALAAAWATASGRLGWWGVVVLAASIAAQAHEIFAPAAAAVCVLSPAIGWPFRRADGTWRSRHWLAIGMATAAALWTAPVVQQLTGRPGNLTLLWNSVGRASGGLHERSGASSSVGFSKALSALGAAVRPFPEWLHIPPRGSALTAFFYTVGTFSGPRGWTVVVLLALLAAAGLALWRGHVGVGALCSVAVIADVAAVITVATTSSRSLEKFAYLDVVWWVVGMLTWIALVAAVAGAAASLGHHVRRLQRPRLQELLRPRAMLATCAALGLAAALSVASLVTNWRLVASELQPYGGWPTIAATQRAASAVEHVAPREPFLLRVRGGPATLAGFAFTGGTAYELRTAGYEPRFRRGTATINFGSWTAARPGLPVVTIYLHGDSLRLSRVTLRHR